MAPFEQGEIGPDLFDAACRMWLEGLVSKHRESVYRPGRCDHWAITQLHATESDSKDGA